MPFQRFSHTFTIWRARLSFPHLFEPRPIMVRGQQVGDPRYSTLVIPPADQCEEIIKIENWLISQSWPDGVPAGVMIKRALAPGDQLRPGDPNLAGKMVLSANAKEDSPPQIVSIHRDGAGNLVTLTERQHVYSGCEANVSVGLYTTQLQASAPQVNCGLNLVQPTERAMDRFDGRITAEQAFGEDPYAGQYAQQEIQGQPGTQPAWQQQGQPQQQQVQYPWQKPQQ